MAGGEKARKRHVEVNRKLLVWDRIGLLVDPGAPLLNLAPLAGLALDYGDVPYGGSVCGEGCWTWAPYTACDGGAGRVAFDAVECHVVYWDYYLLVVC